MTIVLHRPGADQLGDVVAALREWQVEGAPVQLHPGDLGWQWRFGAEETAKGVRTWSRGSELLAVGLVDGEGLVRMGVAPAADDDEELAQQVLADAGHPERGVLPAGPADIEVRYGAAIRRQLRAAGWEDGEAWTPLRRDLTEPVEAPGVHIEVTGPEQAAVRAEVQRAAFDRSTFTAERWQAMAASPAYADARCLVAYDDEGSAVAAVTVWSAGPGRPGLLEPMGTHRDHRGHGYGTAITLAAAAALRDLGSSSATVCTPSANAGGVATYVRAGYAALPDSRDLHRGAVSG